MIGDLSDDPRLARIREMIVRESSADQGAKA
jgi:hypothetical protein